MGRDPRDGLALDSAGAVYLAGHSESRPEQGFPITPGVVQPQKGLESDGFMLRLGGSGHNDPGGGPGDPVDRYRILVPFVAR